MSGAGPGGGRCPCTCIVYYQQRPLKCSRSTCLYVLLLFGAHTICRSGNIGVDLYDGVILGKRFSSCSKIPTFSLFTIILVLFFITINSSTVNQNIIHVNQQPTATFPKCNSPLYILPSTRNPARSPNRTHLRPAPQFGSLSKSSAEPQS
jgi:hypothetical protein